MHSVIFGAILMSGIDNVELLNCWKMSDLFLKSISKAFGPLTRCKADVDKEE